MEGKTMTDYVLSERAKRDIREIGDYTVQTWSEDQALKYIRMLFNQIRVLSRNPRLGRNYDYIRPGLHGYHCGRHIVFYRVLPTNRVRVIRILHERMDYTRHV